MALVKRGSAGKNAVIVRDIQPGDEAILRDMHKRFGYTTPFPETLENYQVLEDDSGRVIAAAGWRMMPEVGMFCEPDKSLHPLVKLKGIAMLQSKLHDIITATGYHEAVAEVLPELEGHFGRHLQRHLGFQKGGRMYRIFGGC
jgi:hypothetical protein